ncbi:pyridoxamine 5'-phosphate oxidase family protein [Patescibacteria group bacterium]|nr:pyridoxamine 5'-phosphate oxidase family protein [Patescibacteria group bacterium]
MDTDLDNARKDALAFLTRNKIGVLGTSSSEGNVHASMVYYTADADFNIYIITLMNSRKFKAIQEHPQVAFTVSVPDVPQTLQIEGVAMDISLDEGAAKKKDELFAVLDSNNWFYAPITKLDPTESVVVWIKPTWIRWADYAFEESGNKHIFKEIPLP